MNIPQGVGLTLAFAAAVALGVSLVNAGIDVAVGLVVIMAFNVGVFFCLGSRASYHRRRE